jgi:hypothetical protein
VIVDILRNLTADVCLPRDISLDRCQRRIFRKQPFGATEGEFEALLLCSFALSLPPPRRIEVRGECPPIHVDDCCQIGTAHTAQFWLSSINVCGAVHNMCAALKGE